MILRVGPRTVLMALPSIDMYVFCRLISIGGLAGKLWGCVFAQVSNAEVRCAELDGRLQNALGSRTTLYSLDLGVQNFWGVGSYNFRI